MSTPTTYRTAPCSPETEQAVLGCCMGTPEAFRKAAAMIGNRQAVFFEAKHAEIWSVLEQWYIDHDAAPDGAYLMSRLFDSIGMDYLSCDIVNARCLAANIEYHTGELLRLWKLRTAQDAGAELARCADGRNLDVVEEILSELNTNMIDSDFVSPLNPMPVESAPIPEAPVFAGGIVPGNMGILAAVDGLGKSFLCLSIALNIATGQAVVPSLRARKHGNVMVLSYEDAPGNVRYRLKTIAEQSGLDDYANGISFYFPEEPMFVPTREGVIQPTRLYHALDSEAARIQPDLIVLDPYSGLSAAPENNNEMGAAIGQHLNALAKKHNTAVLVVHHVGKGQVDSESHLAMRGNSGLPSKARWIARLLSTDTENRLRLHIAKDSYHRRMGDVYFERTAAGPLREITGAELGKSREALARTIASYIEDNPRSINPNAVKLGRGEVVKLFLKCIGATPAEAYRAVELALSEGLLSTESHQKANRSGYIDVLIPGGTQNEEVPF